MASTYLSRTATTSTDKKKFTYSVWLKRADLIAYHRIAQTYLDANNRGYFMFNKSSDANPDTMFIFDKSGGSNRIYWLSTSVFRDTSAWYHIVLKGDSTQSTESERFKVYINGEDISSQFTKTTTIAQNENFGFQSDSASNFVGSGNSGNEPYDGVMAHVHYCDGYSYGADTFGETDATTGIWKPKTAPSVTYGTNGFFLKFENSGAFGTDSSGNANNFTVNGTMTQTIDTPSNVFATINGLDYNSNATLSNGNLSITTSTGGDYIYGYSNLGVMSGKYYIEAKQLLNTSVSIIGVDLMTNCANNVRTNNNPGNTGMTYRGDGQERTVGVNYSFGSSYGQNDIVSIALDMDNYKLYFAKNGVWQGSGDPDAGTGGLDLSNISGYNEDYIGIVFGDYNSSDSSSWQLNFGNGYFGTTAVSSAQNPDDGVGIFEYSPPTGYKALCTKSINSQEYD